jgi:HK97 family phage prohead protease
MTNRPQPELECRTTPLAPEFRSMTSRSIGGYSAVFNTPSRDLGGFVEIVEPSAFNKSRSDGYPDVVCRADHSDILGSTRGGTLTLTIDRNGLDYTCDVAETRSGDDVLALVRRGDYAGSSFAFRCFEDEWRNNGRTLVRHLISVRLVDVSPVAIPAYESATVSLRSLAAQVDAPLADVLDLARDDQLYKLLTRTDAMNPRRYNQSSEAREVGKRSGKQALVEILGMRYPQAPRTVADARAELTRMRYPKPF